MRRKLEVKSFSLLFDCEKEVDIDLLEQQLHSLYKYKNINLDEVSYYNDLAHCNTQATALTVSKKSFVLAVTLALRNHYISLDEFNISTVDSYSTYVLEMILDKNFIARNLRKEIREGVGINGTKLNLGQRAYRLPLAIFAYQPHIYFLNKEKLTKSTAYKRMIDDLLTWEKDIISNLVTQISAEYIPPKKEKDFTDGCKII